MNKETVIITGINGQLGQYMAKYLQENAPDIQIIGTQRHKSYDKQPFIFDASKIIFELMDLSDAHSIENIILKYKPTFFINTAANAFVGDSWKLPAQHFEINALAVMHQLEAIRKHSPKTRYFNMGTSEEFGATERGRLNEQSKLDPKSPYGASKCAARHIVNVWRKSYGLYAVQGWTFNFESELRGEKYVTRKITKAVARIYKAMQNNQDFEPLELGNINSYRSWQHAEDVADGIWRMLNQERFLQKTFGEKYSKEIISPNGNYAIMGLYINPETFRPKDFILSSDTVHTVREFVEKSFNFVGIKGIWHEWSSDSLKTEYILSEDEVIATKKKVTLVKINPEFYRPADVTYLHGDASEIKRELGWNPKVTTDALIERMIKHDLTNQ